MWDLLGRVDVMLGLITTIGGAAFFVGKYRAHRPLLRICSWSSSGNIGIRNHPYFLRIPTERHTAGNLTPWLWVVGADSAVGPPLTWCDKHLSPLDSVSLGPGDEALLPLFFKPGGIDEYWVDRPHYRSGKQPPPSERFTAERTEFLLRILDSRSRRTDKFVVVTFREGSLVIEPRPVASWRRWIARRITRVALRFVRERPGRMPKWRKKLFNELQRISADIGSDL